MAKNLYFFNEGDCRDKKLLGGKGAGLCEMTHLGLPVPPGFTITTEVCRQYYALEGKLPSGLMDEVREAMYRVEKSVGKKFGDPSNPLLVSVRSGASISMPGMMDTILNLGLNNETVKGLISQTGDERFAYDAYRRLIQLYGKIVMDVDDRLFSEIFEETKQKVGAKYDNEVSPKALRQIVTEFKEIIMEKARRPFPEDAYEQLDMAIAAVFDSWMGKRCVDYRKEFNITRDIADGTAVNVVTMVFGNMGNDSATGVIFTRDPSTGERRLYGDYLINAQGEDVVAGIRTPKPIQELEKEMPENYQSLVKISEELEKHFKEPQDLEFTIERGKLYMLQTRNAKMSPAAVIKTSVDMVKEGILTKSETVLKLKPDILERLLHRKVDPSAEAIPITQGIDASPGAASGKVVFDADEAERQGKRGLHVILVREETKPEDIHGFFVAQGILTSRGGKTSHAAVVARGMGKPCVCGAGDIHIDLGKHAFIVGSTLVKEGDIITIDGSSGKVFLGYIPLIEPKLADEFAQVLMWADELRVLGVRANADTPEAARLAIQFGAEGIGLCRTERMFNAVDRLPIVVEMIMSDSKEKRRSALDKLKPLQKNDLKEILKAMEGFPVTIRLLDPPLHEFLPSIEELLHQIYSDKSGASKSVVEEKQAILEKVKSLVEVNPMLGHRGVRVGVTYPEIYEMQIAAICEATAELLKEGIDVKPQIMVPQVGAAEELWVVKDIVERVIKDVEEEDSLKLPIKFGTMIEVVRACVTADRIAKVVEFFSFGTNDLTQGVFSFSREDAENKFLPQYVEKRIMNENPFQTIDIPGVGRLMEICFELGRRSKADLEVGICGEHGGDPPSIEFCQKIGLNYVSCSPYRIPVARLAAAQAALRRTKEY